MEVARRRHRLATPPRSTASRSRCSTRTRRSPCGGGCRRACACITGDDFNYAELIAGDAQGYSDALLGIFDAIAPAASAALGALARGDVATFHDILAPTVPLSRHIFKAPTRFYKTGVVFMAYLNGLQDHFTMVGGQESARSTAASGRAVPPGRRGRPARRSGAGGAAHDAPCMATRGVATDARSLQRPLAARDQLRDGEAVDAGAARRGLRARRHHGDRAVARHRAGRRRREGRQADPRARA